MTMMTTPRTQTKKTSSYHVVEVHEEFAGVVTDNIPALIAAVCPVHLGLGRVGATIGGVTVTHSTFSQADTRRTHNAYYEQTF